MALLRSLDAVAAVSTGAIAANVSHFVRRARPGAAVMAIVKANGYGHGSVQAAQAALEGGAAWLGVARAQEGLELRRAGISAPVLHMGYTPPELYAQAIAHGLCTTVFDAWQVAHAAEVAERVGRRADVQVKVDTGMGRLGVQPEDAPALIAEVRRRGAHLNLLGIFTHMARADEDSAANAEQLARFGDVLRRIQDLGVPLPRFIHAANSAATLRIGASVRDFSIVRPGINIYGLRYSPETPLAAELQPALRWSTQLSLVKVLPPGSGVSYGHTYVTSKAQRIGTCPIGYGDGYRRSKGNQVLVGGRRVNVLGRVCMDSIMIDLDPVPEARVGDEVVLLGAQGAQQILASELATRWGTIDYEVTCGISPRVPRVYTQELLGPEAAGR